MLDNLKITADIQQDKDTLGGGTRTLPTGVYDAKIDMAWFEKAASGALGLKLVFRTANGDLIRQTLWVTSGDAKGNKNHYIDKQGAKRLLPGMAMADQLCRLTLDKQLGELTTEEKVIKLWSTSAKAEVPTKVPALMDLVGKELKLGVHHIIENKNTKGSDGQYYPSNDKREYNEVDKFFSPDGRTQLEKQANEPASFLGQWKDKFGNRPIDNFKEIAGTASPFTTAASASETPSLFG